MLPLLLTLVLGIMDFGRALNYWIEQTHLSNEAARWAVVNNWPGCKVTDPPISSAASPCSSPTLQKYIHDSVETKELKAGVKVCVAFPAGTPAKSGDPVKVTLSLPFKWLGFFQGFGTSNIGSSATMRLEVKPTHFNSGCYSA